MSDKLKRRPSAKVTLFASVAFLIGFVAVFSVQMYNIARNEGGIGLGELVATIPVLIIIALMLPFMKHIWESAKLGLPAEDELSRATKNRAGALTFYISLFVWLAIGMFGEGRMEVGQASGLAIMISAVIFLVAISVLQRKAAQ